MESIQKVNFQDLGKISFAKAWQLQERLLKALIDQKRSQREIPKEEKRAPVHSLLFCEHTPVFTLGKSGKMDHLLLSPDLLTSKGIQFYKINRGGDITYHGPGQVVGYPIFDLDWFFTDVHRYIRTLEEVIIRTLKEYDLNGIRMEGFTGVWLAPKGPDPYRKICAIGVHLSRWITMHGFAFNINTDLNHFKYIVPCGINDKNKIVTSLERELGQKVSIAEIKEKLLQHFKTLFQFKLENEFYGET